MGQQESTVQIVGGAAVASGVLGTLTPSLLAKLFGVAAENGEVRFLLRLSGIGNLALGINLLRSPESEWSRLLTVAATADAITAVVALAAPLPARTRVMIALSTGAVAAIAGASLPTAGSHTR